MNGTAFRTLIVAVVVACWCGVLATSAPAAIERHALPDVDGLASNLLFEPGGDLRFVLGDAPRGVGRLTPAGSLAVEHDRFGYGPTRTLMARSSDGALWAVEQYDNGVSRIGPDESEQAETFGPSIAFNALATGPDGAVYSATHGEDVMRLGLGSFGRLSATSFDGPIAPAFGNSFYDIAFLGGRLYLMGNARCQTVCAPARLVEIDPAAPAGEQRRETAIPALDYGTNFESIVAGPDGRLWVQDGSRPRTVHRFTPAGADAPLTLPPGARLRALEAGPAGTVLAITDEAAVALIRPDGTLTEWCPLNPELAQRGAGHDYFLEAVTGPGDAIWFSSRGEVGRLTTDTPAGAGCAPSVTTTDVRLDGNDQQPGAALTAVFARGGGRLPDFIRPADPEIPGHGVRFELEATSGDRRTVPVMPTGNTATAYVEGLEGGQTYTARALVTTRFGTATGPGVTFTTPPPPSLQVTGDRITDGFPAIDVAVEPHGSHTFLSIDYGPTPALGNVNGITSIGADESSRALTIRMTGAAYDLRDEPEFHYRLVATNGRGTTRTESRMLMVPPRSTEPGPSGGTTTTPVFIPGPVPGGTGSGTVFPPGGGRSVEIDSHGPVLRIPASNRTITAGRTGAVRFRIGPAEENTTGSIALKTTRPVRTASGKRRVVGLGTKAFQALDGQVASVGIVLSKANQRILRKAGRLLVQATVVLRDARGNATVKRYGFALRAPQR